ncbi:MAG: glycosyltransferase [Promethearchaeota archaeon]
MVFIHTASHGGMNERKGTKLLIEAMKYVKSDIKLIIYSWKPYEFSDKRIENKVVNFKNYWQVWREGDILVYPQDYNGICLPIVEAMASGLAVITTDIYPFNKYIPKELMFKSEYFYTTRAAPNLMEVDAAHINPKSIAQKIDEWANKDISKFSEYGKKWAKENSWGALLPKYIKLFNEL